MDALFVLLIALLGILGLLMALVLLSLMSRTVKRISRKLQVIGDIEDEIKMMDRIPLRSPSIPVDPVPVDPSENPSTTSTSSNLSTSSLQFTNQSLQVQEPRQVDIQSRSDMTGVNILTPLQVKHTRLEIDSRSNLSASQAWDQL